MPKIVKVKILDKSLMAHNGQFMHIGIDKALRGERQGIWVIVNNSENVYEDKSMAAEIMEREDGGESLSSKDYKTKTSYSNVALGRNNLFHR